MTPMASLAATAGSARIHAAFRAGARPAGSVLPFITGGFPSLDSTRALLPRLAQAGAAAIEVGIPFSDPIADGPEIGRAHV